MRYEICLLRPLQIQSHCAQCVLTNKYKSSKRLSITHIVLLGNIALPALPNRCESQVNQQIIFKVSDCLHSNGPKDFYGTNHFSEEEQDKNNINYMHSYFFVKAKEILIFTHTPISIARTWAQFLYTHTQILRQGLMQPRS